MKIHPVQINNIQATAIENTPIGSFCIVPTVLDKNILLSDDERLLIKKKSNLLCDLLKDEGFLSEVAYLYEDNINLPPIIVSFNRFYKEDKGPNYIGKTSNNILDIEGHKGRFVELNFLDVDSKLRDVDRLLFLWEAFLSLALFHSPMRPYDINKVAPRSESQAKRAWLLAIKKEKIKNPRKKFVMGIERSYIRKARPKPFC